MAGFSNGTAFLDARTFTTSSGDNNDVEVQGSLLYVVTSNNNDAVTGLMADPSMGWLLFLANASLTNKLVIKHNSSSSASGNRIMVYNGMNLTLLPSQTVLIGYDVATAAWYVFRSPLTSVAPVADGTYTLGTGETKGTLTLEGGVVTALQQNVAYDTKVFTATVAGGAGDAVFYATDTGLVGGTALFSSILAINARFDSGNPNLGNDKPVVSNGNKTVTIACKQQTFSGVTVLGINVLGSNTVGVAPNGTALTITVTGILA